MTCSQAQFGKCITLLLLDLNRFEENGIIMGNMPQRQLSARDSPCVNKASCNLYVVLFVDIMILDEIRFFVTAYNPHTHIKVEH